jgi:hypothetical protein
LPIELAKDFERFRNVRNQAAHGASDKISKLDLEVALKSAMNVLEAIDKIETIESFTSDESAV